MVSVYTLYIGPYNLNYVDLPSAAQWRPNVHNSDAIWKRKKTRKKNAKNNRWQQFGALLSRCMSSSEEIINILLFCFLSDQKPCKICVLEKVFALSECVWVWVWRKKAIAKRWVTIFETTRKCKKKSHNFTQPILTICFHWNQTSVRTRIY